MFICCIIRFFFAMHPNYMECSDPTCTPIMNKGEVIKYDANMHYATTAFSSAVFQEICHKTIFPIKKQPQTLT